MSRVSEVSLVSEVSKVSLVSEVSLVSAVSLVQRVSVVSMTGAGLPNGGATKRRGLVAAPVVWRMLLSTNWFDALPEDL